MIHNGHDYQPYNSVVSLSSPGYLYIYYTLGQIAASTQVDSMSENITNVDIETVGSLVYAFVDAYYPSNGTYQDEVDIRINSSPAVHKFFSWSAIVGYETYKGPIWKDYVYTIPVQASRIQYLLKYNGNAIYKGWSYETGQNENKICVNEIARDYLYSNYPEAQNVWYQDYSAEKDFELYIGLSENDEPQTKVSNIHFTYDWSYDLDYLSIPSEAWIAMEPLQDYYDTRQYQIFSVNDTSTVRFNNTTYTNSRTGRSIIKTQFNTPGTITLQHGGYSRSFTVKDNCGLRYCLYYVNSRGGWDSVLVDGVSMKTDKYDRETYTQNYLTPSRQRGVIEYRNNITESWTLYLRSIGDSKNPLFHNLFESTNVFLHDLEEGRVLPVIITSTEMQYKTRKNQGRKLYTYQITVESAQRKLRM